MIAELNLQNTDSSVKSEGEEPNVNFTHQVKNILRINLEDSLSENIRISLFVFSLIQIDFFLF